MKRIFALATLVLFALLAGACGAAATAVPSSRNSGPSPALPPVTEAQSSDYGAPAPNQPKTVPAGGAAGSYADATTAQAADRLIIKTANLSLTVKDAMASLETVKGIASSMGGYVSNSQTTRINPDQVQVNVTVRVPADKFDDTLKQIKQNGIRVNSENTGGQDVTEEYTDLNARLRNLTATETELLALMTTVREKTGKAEDILAVQRELNNVRMQIEQLKGRMQYLERSTAMATLTIALIPDTLSAPVAPQVWDPAVVARDALRSLVVALQGGATLVIYLLVFVLPVILIVGIPLFIIWRLLRRPRKVAASR